MSNFEAHIDSTRGICRVITGPMRRSYQTTPYALGLALLSDYADLRGDIPRSQSYTWVDQLATHGMAVGTRQDRQVILSIIPAKERTVQRHSRNETTGAAVTQDITVTFPPMLLGLQLVSGNYRKGVIMLADTSRQSTFSVVSTTPVLVPFPYGNIYAESGYICWGTVSHRDIHSIRDLEELFFGSGFNRDLFNQSVAGVSRLDTGVMPTPPATAFSFTFPSTIERLISG